MKIDFLFQTSPWLILPCLLLAGIYAYFLYKKTEQPWSKQINLGLAALRFVVVAILALLFLPLLLRQIKQTVQKKTVVLAVDNSTSMIAHKGTALQGALQALARLKETLVAKDYEVAWVSFDNTPPANEQAIRFNQRQTDLSALLNNVQNTSEGSNLVDVVLLSDGIINEGVNPSNQSYTFAIHTIGIGDTIPSKDIRVKTVYANKIAYLGNKFPVQADIAAYGFTGKTTEVLLKQGEKVLDKQRISFKQNDDLQTITFTPTALNKGVQHLTIETIPLAGEESKQNNRQEVYVEVIDGKEKVLLLALSPHPDIKALRSMLSKQANLEVEVKILSEDPNLDFRGKNYDALILHQLPDLSNNYTAIYKELLAKKIPCLYILGSQSNTSAFNSLNKAVSVLVESEDLNQATGYFNTNFSLVNLDAKKLELLKQLPPINVTYGRYTLLPNTSVMLYQKIGNAITDYPLLVLNQESPKSAAFLGEGLWGWYLGEYQQTEQHEVIDEIFTKTIQFLSAKEDKRKLRVYPTNAAFVLGDKVVFENELYNSIYEKLYNIPIQLSLTDEKGLERKYTYSTTAENTRFELSALPAGLYRFKASATLLGAKEVCEGQFVVKDQQQELMQTTADFDVLRQLSGHTGGSFVLDKQIEKLTAIIENHAVAEKIEAEESLQEIINLRWIAFLVLALLTAEWILRKFMGGY